jgi:catechol 2,3-dioxygenase-like lactoylglutathione lyase family enzyme
MEVRGVSHVAIGVRDMDAALPFYRDILGMRVTFEGIEEFGGSLGRPITKRRAAYLRNSDEPGASFLVLDQQLSRDPAGGPAELFQVGLHHFGLWVDDLDGIVARAVNAGVEPLRPPSDADTVAYGEAPGGVIRTVFFKDADGNVVQCDQRMG